MLISNQASKDIISEPLKKAFEKNVNDHGYAFQYKVQDYVNQLYKENKSSWVFEASEFPVEVNDTGTRIDFILRHANLKNFLILAECKRANSAISNWCFARAPMVRRGRTHERFFLEQTAPYRNENNQIVSGTIRSLARPYCLLENAYHMGIEVASNQKGESNSDGRGAIEKAASQVCRGLNGMVEFFDKNDQNLEEVGNHSLMPVIFTTAKLWTSNADFSTTDIIEGRIDLSNSSFAQVNWLAYQYHISPGIKHTLSPLRKQRINMRDFLDQEYIRTIPIVSASGIEEFLSWSSNDDHFTE